MPKREPKPLQKRSKRRLMSREEREKHCINLAYDLVEQRLEDGTATAAETVHFLKLGSTRELLERELMEKKKELDDAKTEMYNANVSSEERMLEAMKAFREYSGNPDGNDYDEY